MKVLIFIFLHILSFSLCAEQKDPLKKNAYISGNVFDENKVKTSVHIDIIDFETKQLVEQLESSNGNFRISVPQKNDFIVYFSKPGYLFQSVLVSIPDSVGFEKKLPDIVLQKMEVEKKTILNSLSFDFYQAIVLEESRPDLERVIALLNENLALQIEISGFTDNIGSVTFLRKLTEQRAKSVVDILISSGFDKTRIKYKGYGALQPLGSNFTEEGRQQNNRIELKVLSLDLPVKKDTKQKKGILSGIKKEETVISTEEDEAAKSAIEDEKEAEIAKFEQEQEEFKDSVEVALKKAKETSAVPLPDTLSRIDYKGKFIADKKPLAFSTVNLVSTYGEILKTSKTDENGIFEFKDIEADEEVTFGFDPEETKDFKKIFLADTTGTVVKELDKINGEFVLTLLPSEKTKLGKVYLVDPPLKALKPKLKNAFIIGRVVDESNHPIKAQIEVIDNTTNQPVEKAQSNSEGRFKITSALKKNYDITFIKSGYLFQSVSVIIPDSGGYEKNLGDVTLQKVEVGKKIVLNNIFFDSNESTLRKESFSELERAVKLMNDMASLQIEISGHTDNIGSSKSNRQLSELRAKAVKDYLVSQGCDKDRLKYKGYGSGQPISTNNTEIGRQMNRRTEFKVLKVDLAAEQIAKAKKMKEDSSIDNKEAENGASSDDQQKKSTNTIPTPLKNYDKDNNGIISYSEIVIAIDAFFDGNEKASGDNKGDDSIFALLDFYFDQ
ncbi:MAG: OmpA family protein [Bacteroidetes bacterium]|nr:OmpA family protein [Bacteroidota bacterium]